MKKLNFASRIKDMCNSKDKARGRARWIAALGLFFCLGAGTWAGMAFLTGYFDSGAAAVKTEAVAGMPGNGTAAQPAVEATAGKPGDGKAGKTATEAASEDGSSGENGDGKAGKTAVEAASEGGSSGETGVASGTGDSGEAKAASETKKLDIKSSFGDKELPIYSVDTKEKKIALSFDAAWGAEDFPQLMETLEKHKAKVTFFMTGGWVEQNPDCVRYLAKHGHDLGNHSQHHYDMATIDQEKQRREIQSVHDKVKDLTGYEMFLFRPPYGSYDNSLIKTLYDMNYYPIQWSVDSLDWKNYGVQSVIDTVCNHKNLGPGAIILCHNAAKYTADALDTMLMKLEEKGYQIVPISQLILRDKYHMDVNGKQIPTSERVIINPGYSFCEVSGFDGAGFDGGQR